MKISKTFLDRLYERKHKQIVLLREVESLSALSTDEPAHAPTTIEMLKERCAGLQASIASADAVIASYLCDHQ